MRIILIFVLFNLSTSRESEKINCVSSKYTEIDISDVKLSFEDDDSIIEEINYFIRQAYSSVNVDVHNYVMPLRLFLFQPIRAPPV